MPASPFDAVVAPNVMSKWGGGAPFANSSPSRGIQRSNSRYTSDTMHTTISRLLCAAVLLAVAIAPAGAQRATSDLASGSEVVPLDRGGDPDLSSPSQDLDYVPTARLRQEGRGTRAEVVQRGDDNSAVVQQAGLDNAVSVRQRGTANRYALDLSGDGNDIAVRQNGNDNEVRQRLTNSYDNQIEFVQNGDANLIEHRADGLSSKEITVRQDGSNMEMVIEQSTVPNP